MIRHCESEDDVLDCYGGCADFDLTAKGIDTAINYSTKLVDLVIEKVFTSPYKRAKNVAKIFSDKLGCDIEIVNDLREINTYGVMAGVNKDLAKEIFELLLNSDEYKEIGYYKGKSFYGGEPIEEFDKRIKNGFNYLISKNYNTIAIVTHGGVFRSVYKNILNKSEKILEIEDVATIEIEYANETFNILNTKGIEID
jgi:broad specificity phosphatase PhoE